MREQDSGININLWIVTGIVAAPGLEFTAMVIRDRRKNDYPANLYLVSESRDSDHEPVSGQEEKDKYTTGPDRGNLFGPDAEKNFPHI